MDHQEIMNLLPLAALGRLEPDEALALQEHLRAGCAECEAELRAYREAGAALAIALEGGQDDPEHRIWEHLEKRLHTNAAAAHSLAHAVSRPAHIDGTERRSSAGWWRAAAVVAAAAAIALMIYDRSIVQQTRMDEVHHLGQLEKLSWQLSNMSADLRNARIEADTLRSVISERTRLDHVLLAPDLQLTRLAPLKPAGGGASALVAVSRATKQGMIRAFELPQTPSDKTYEFWWITKQSGPVRAGTFFTGGHRTVVAPISPPPAGQRVVLAAVTLEPSGGTNKPTGPMYLKGAPDLE
jgi:anti-sigma-K factor RskA